MDYSATNWRLTKDEEGRKEWNHSGGAATAILVLEKLTIAGEDLAEIAIKNMEANAERYKVKEMKRETRNGLAMTCADAEFTRSKLDFVYRGCFWGGDKIAVQLIGVALAENAGEALPKLEEFWQGFRVVPKLAP